MIEDLQSHNRLAPDNKSVVKHVFFVFFNIHYLPAVRAPPDAVSYPLCWKSLLPHRVWGAMRAATGVPPGSVDVTISAFATFLYLF